MHLLLLLHQVRRQHRQQQELHQQQQELLQQHQRLQPQEVENCAVIQMVFLPTLLIVKNTTSVLMEHLMSTLVPQELCGVMT